MPIDDKTSIQSHEEAAYKYLDVDENSGIQHSAMKEKLAKEYYRRVRLILRSELNFKNKLSAINALAVPLPTYSFGVIEWRKSDIEKMDRKTRKLLAMHGLHQRSRLYIKRRNGGRGLVQLMSAYAAPWSIWVIILSRANTGFAGL